VCGPFLAVRPLAIGEYVRGTRGNDGAERVVAKKRLPAGVPDPVHRTGYTLTNLRSFIARDAKMLADG
jgi:hypothetical protein